MERDEVRDHHSRRLCRRAAGVAGRQDAARRRPDTPAMDAIAAAGVVGRANNVPSHLPAGSDVANLSLLGLRPGRPISPAALRWKPPPRASNSGRTTGPFAAIWSRSKTRSCVTLPPVTSRPRKHASCSRSLQAGARQSPSWSSCPASAIAICCSIAATIRPPRFRRETRTTPPHDLTDKSVTDDFPRVRAATC